MAENNVLGLREWIQRITQTPGYTVGRLSHKIKKERQITLQITEDNYPYYTQRILAQEIAILFKTDPHRDIILHIIRHTFKHTNILIESGNLHQQMVSECVMPDTKNFEGQLFDSNLWIHLLIWAYLTAKSNPYTYNRTYNILKQHKDYIYRHFQRIYQWTLRHPEYSHDWLNRSILN